MGFSNENVQKIEEGYLVEGDIILTEEDLQITVDPLTLRIAETEQYRTNNLVTGLPRTINVSMDSQLNGTAGYSAALDVAIARYNAQNLQIPMVRVGTSGGDIHLKKQPGNYLASAGFPTNQGDPFNLIKLNSNAIGSGIQMHSSTIAQRSWRMKWAIALDSVIRITWIVHTAVVVEVMKVPAMLVPSSFRVLHPVLMQVHGCWLASATWKTAHLITMIKRHWAISTSSLVLLKYNPVMDASATGFFLFKKKLASVTQASSIHNIN
jgi:hypothetical protein